MKQLFGFAIEARDGRIGKVEDFFFDDYVWRIRYLVARTGGWLLRNSVLISPAALDLPRPEDRCFPVKLTQEQVRNSPDVDADKPVSRQMEESLQLHYGWPPYWAMEPFVMAPAPELTEGNPAALAVTPSGDPHLRSVRETTGYQVHASDRESHVGTVSDFILDDDDWTVRYVVVEATAEDGKRDFVLNPWWTLDIDWLRRTMHFDISTAEIQLSPGFDPSTSLNRDYEVRLHENYGRIAYWDRQKR
ncbi:MAG TPA: PRC-barrel domain-containing protein [Paludibaculum sp.]|jgi:sporulation protein YlmC with PRC-barrel domain